MQESEKLRIDKWLWAARFFKTRRTASDAVSKGQVLVNGQKIKPSRNIAIGDVLEISREAGEYTITILALNDKRRPASEASLLYEESEESIRQRELSSLQRKQDWLVARGLRGEGRPNKRQRRQIVRFRTNQNAYSSEHSSTGDNNDKSDDPE